LRGDKIVIGAERRGVVCADAMCRSRLHRVTYRDATRRESVGGQGRPEYGIIIWRGRTAA